MESIEGRSFVRACGCVVLVAAFAWPLCSFAAESAPKVEVSDELARLTKDAYAAKSGTEKRDALAELATLRELSGDIEGAAAAWTDAASATGGEKDEPALLEAARCLIAMGELDRAFTELSTLLITGRDAQAVSRARYLAAQIAAFRGDEDAVATLSAFIDDPLYADRRPATLYLLWRISSDESFRIRLLADHRASPEAALAAGVEQAPISVVRTPLWLFLSARDDGVPVPGPSAPIVAGTGAADAPSIRTGIPETAAAVQQAPVAGAESISRPVLQIGLFRREENAKALMKRLGAAGFKAELMRRIVGTDEYFAVTVAGGDEADKTALRLKDAGFESFPLF